MTKSKQKAARTRSQRPHELEIMDTQGPRAAPKIFIPWMLLDLLRWQRMLLLREVRHELFLLFYGRGSFFGTHRRRG
jgi:hypothetical protein